MVASGRGAAMVGVFAALFGCGGTTKGEEPPVAVAAVDGLELPTPSSLAIEVMIEPGAVIVNGQRVAVDGAAVDVPLLREVASRDPGRAVVLYPHPTVQYRDLLRAARVVAQTGERRLEVAVAARGGVGAIRVELPKLQEPVTGSGLRAVAPAAPNAFGLTVSVAENELLVFAMQPLNADLGTVKQPYLRLERGADGGFDVRAIGQRAAAIEAEAVNAGRNVVTPIVVSAQSLAFADLAPVIGALLQQPGASRRHDGIVLAAFVE